MHMSLPENFNERLRDELLDDLEEELELSLEDLSPELAVNGSVLMRD